MSLSSKDLAMFYAQLGTMLGAGVPVQQAMVSLVRTTPRRLRRVVEEMSGRVGAGEPLHEAMESFEWAFPVMDCRVLEMCGKSGALDRGLASLASYHEARASARGKMISATILPGLQGILAFFVANLPRLVQGLAGNGNYGTADYLWDTLGVLTQGVFVLAGVILLIRMLLRLPGTDVMMDRLLNAIPVYGAFRRDYVLSQWVGNIRLMLNAGHGVVEAMEKVSLGSGSPALASAFLRAKPELNGLLPVSQALEMTRFFPDILVQFWGTGEQSGRMDEMLDRLSKYYEDQWRRQLDRLAMWLPRLVYGVIAAYIVYQIFQLAMVYVSAINNAINSVP